MLNSEIITEYSKNFHKYQEFTSLCYKALVKRLSERPDLNVNSVTFRTEEITHLHEKIELPGKVYTTLKDINDLVGIRVITYFPDDVDRVSSIVRDEFDILKDKSTDKRELMDQDGFGYLSLDHICKLNSKHFTLRHEEEAYRDFCFKVQIRSILQHAWSEIEDDLSYKYSGGIPEYVRRRFSRLSSLLEVADNEFLRIRNELNQCSANVRGQIQTKPSKVFIDRIPLGNHINKDENISALESTLAKLSNSLVKPNKGFLHKRIEEIQTLGINTIAEIKSKLKKLRSNNGIHV